MKTDFRSWKQENLAQLAFDLSGKIAELEEELRHCKGDLKAAMEAYRNLNKDKEYD